MKSLREALAGMAVRDRAVALELRVLAEPVRIASVVQLLQREGAHAGAQEQVWVVGIDRRSGESLAST